MVYLNDYSIKELTNNYNTRQMINKHNNSKLAGKFLDNFNIKAPFETNDNIYNLKALMIMILNSKNKDAINYLYKYLHIFNYHYQGELIEAHQTIDSFNEKKIDYDLFNISMHGLYIINSLNILPHNNYFIDSKNGNFLINKIPNILDIDVLSYDDRKRKCHDLTSSALYQFPKLYGAYYYIPQAFCGYLEHSVLIDLDKKIVYDLANNCSVSLDIWQKFFPKYSFIISGKKYIKINEQIQEEYNITINLAHLEELKRLRKK